MGLFQGRMKLCKSYYDSDIVRTALNLITVMILCGISRVGIGTVFDCCKVSGLVTFKYDGLYTVPFLYDFIACIMVITYYVVPLMNFFMNCIPCKQKIQTLTTYLEAVNLFLICCSPVLYDLCTMLILLSGDVELNPGPDTLKTKSISVCHINIRSLSHSKLLAIQSSLCDNYDVITV